MAKVVRRKRDVVEAQVAAHLHNYKTSGAELIMGTGRFVAPKTLEVNLNDGGTRTLAAAQVFLNLGTHAAIPSVPGLEAARPLTHIEALELDTLPAASDRDRGRLFRPRTGAGLSSLRKRGDDR
jgi:pyruvate/2-oxoglutarate dehydrogenase complex dihydrolipoamide dehydrogenase (E3) component